MEDVTSLERVDYSPDDVTVAVCLAKGQPKVMHRVTVFTVTVLTNCLSCDDTTQWEIFNVRRKDDR